MNKDPFDIGECELCAGHIDEHECMECGKFISKQTCDDNEGLCDDCTFAEARL